MDNRKNVSSQLKSADSDSCVSYGGAKYRLAYDSYQENRSKRERLHPAVIIGALIVFFVFAALGSFTMKYYNDSVSGLYGASESREENTGSFQSYTGNNAE